MQIILRFAQDYFFLRKFLNLSLFKGLVEERTSDYLAEKKKAEELLYQLLPAYVFEDINFLNLFPFGSAIRIFVLN